MHIKDFSVKFEEAVPRAIAWEKDNVGLLIGSPDATITNILICVDITEDIIDEAVRKKANLIVSHHPLLFHPVKHLVSGSRIPDLVVRLIQKNINVYAAHTNFDSIVGGVNTALAAQLKLQNIQTLVPMMDTLIKIAVFVPESHLDKVADAMHTSGAGMFKKYDHCSFRTNGIGTFKGSAEAQPFIGSRGTIEQTPEIRLEMLCEQWKISRVLSAMLAAHPYEEVAYDLYPLVNENREFGIGAIGTLKKEMTLSSFIRYAAKQIGVPQLRYSAEKRIRSIRSVAVCGGSGSQYIRDAIRQKADAFITSDISYHTFQEFEREILLIDAGHYETEMHALHPLQTLCESIISTDSRSHRVFITKENSNPIHYYHS